MQNNRVLAIDESGNTGNNITDESQPYFCLSSVLLSNEDIRFVSNLMSCDAKEYHFVNFKRRKSHQDKLLRLFNSSIIDRLKIKQSVVDKSYGTTCQLVDLLIEPVLFKNGIDIYKDGVQYGYANTLHALITSMSFGENTKIVLHDKFVGMMRKQDGPSKADFYKSFEELYVENKDKDHVQMLTPIINSFWIIEEVIKGMDKYQLDFTFGSFLYLTGQWTKQFDSKPYDIALDKSKQFTYWSELIKIVKSKSLMKPSAFSKHLSDVQYPISANEVKQVDSVNRKDVQIADLIGSATTYALKERDKENPSSFALGILDSNLLDTISHILVFDKNHIKEMKNRENSMEYIIENISPNRLRYENQ
jgi:hypothetical protein